MYIYNTAARMDLNTIIEEKNRGGAPEVIEKALYNFIEETKHFDRIDLGGYFVPSNMKPHKKMVMADITWRVIAKEGTKLFLLSENCLDWNCFEQPINLLIPVTETSWSVSSVREFLNNHFLHYCFNDTERELIVTTTLTTEPNPYYCNVSSEVTEDKVFLLSCEEVDRYVSCNPEETMRERIDDKLVWAYLYLENDRAQADMLTIDSPIAGRDYHVMTKRPHSWWLRTSGESKQSVAAVCEDGCFIDLGGLAADSDEVGIRPAMWVDISKIK